MTDRLLTDNSHGKTYCTTPEILREEHQLLELARNGRGTQNPICKRKEFSLKNTHMNDQQVQSVYSILTSTDQVQTLEGAAGTGKTTVLQEIKNQCDKQGQLITALAPSTAAAKSVLKDAGFAQAETLQRFLTDPDLQKKAKGSLLMIDEASLIGIADMSKVLDLSHQNNMRVLLVGDTKQHRSVMRGDAFRLLAGSGITKPNQLTSVIRQKTEGYKAAVEHVRKGEFYQGLKHLGEMAAIKPANLSAFAKDYTDAMLKDSGKSFLAVVPTHAEGSIVTAHIRDYLQKEKRLIGLETMRHTLKAVQLSGAQKTDSVYYQVGHYIQFIQNATGIKKGDTFKVTGKPNRDSLFITDAMGNEKQIRLNLGQKLQVFEEKFLPLCKGEKIQITQNGKTKDGKHRLVNGSVHQVKNLSPDGSLVLQNGWQIAPDFKHLKHGYVTTSHASQGKTVDQVFVLQTVASRSVESLEQFYVSITRARHAVNIYTDDKDHLMQLAHKIEARHFAKDMFQEKQPERSPAKTRTAKMLNLLARLGGKSKQKTKEKEAEKTSPTSQPTKTISGVKRHDYERERTR